MPVDKFGRNCDRTTTTVYTGINIANLTNSFLRRDGGNTAIGGIDMNGHIMKNVSNPLSNQDVATKNYVDTNALLLYCSWRCCVWGYKIKCWFLLGKESMM